MKRILITGVTGLIGRSLAHALRRRGDEVWGLSRSADGAESHIRRWDPTAEVLDPDSVSGFDVVVHLAGENIGDGRWTRAKKERIKHSRIHGTRILSEALARAPAKPRLLVAGSAVGYYGNRGSELLSESSGPGTGFLAEVVIGWEDAVAAARDAEISVATIRTGPVLSTNGGALAKMLPPFRIGLGGVVGSGRQYMSWIALGDVVGACAHVIDGEISGVVNVVAPNPVTNEEFTRALGRTIRRPTIIPLPAVAARAVLGEMADELLLVSQRVSSARLEQSGFQFELPTVQEALAHLLATQE